jgi:Asp-tRNA(Asn)/Glu-tRNA(Gln) amidotransferase A subunit family amidase
LEPERPHHRREFLGRGLTLGVSAAAIAPVALKADDKERDKFPTAIQLDGRAYSENRLLALAVAFQSATSWHLLNPEVK